MNVPLSKADAQRIALKLCGPPRVEPNLIEDRRRLESLDAGQRKAIEAVLRDGKAHSTSAIAERTGKSRRATLEYLKTMEANGLVDSELGYTGKCNAQTNYWRRK